MMSKHPLAEVVKAPFSHEPLQWKSRSVLWSVVRILHLHVNMRLRNGGIHNNLFENFLGQIGSDPADVVRLPPQMHKCSSIDNLIEHVYPGLTDPLIATPDYLNQRILLLARNDDVHEINSKTLHLFHGDVRTYMAADTVDKEDRHRGNYGNEFINKLNPSGLPPFELNLKVGCPIILLRNIAPKEGLCNGTMLMVVRFGIRLLEARILTGAKAGTLIFIPRISLCPKEGELPFSMTRRQFPVKLAFALTINKAQGQSVEIVGVDLRTTVFTHGQLYVALSRCTSFESISVLLEDTMKPTTTNIVFPEVLLR